MGIDISRPQRELLLPAETLRECRPEHCWCQTGSHRSTKWIYTEQGRDGRERYHDPIDYIPQIMNGGLWPPWRGAQDWTTRDFDRLGEIMSEYQSRQRGRAGGFGGTPPWMGGPAAAMPFAALAAMPFMMDDLLSPPSSGRHRVRTGHSRSELYGMIQQLRQRAQRQEAWQQSVDDDWYGSEKEARAADRERKLFDMFSKWQASQNGAMPAANGPITGVPCGTGSIPPPGMNGGYMPYPNQMNMSNAMSPNVGMGHPGHNMMYPGGMDQQQAAVIQAQAAQARAQAHAQAYGGAGAYGDDVYGGGGMGVGGAGGRRNVGRMARRRARMADLDDEYDDDFDGMLDVRGDIGRGRRSRRYDDEDPYGGGLGNERRSPRGPLGGPRGGFPRRPPNRGPGGGMGVAYDDDIRPGLGSYRDVPPRRPSPEPIVRPAPVQPIPLGRILTPEPEPEPPIVVGSPPPDPRAARMRQAGPASAIPLRYGEPRRPPPDMLRPGGDASRWDAAYGGMGDVSGMGAPVGGAPYPGGGYGAGMPGPTSAYPPMSRHPSIRFQNQEAGLAQPRADEEMRGEPPAGASKGARDTSPTRP